MECYTTARPLLREHTNFKFFSTALLLLEESPLSFVAGSCSLFFYFGRFMHVCMPEGLPEGRQWVHELGEVNKEIPLVKNYSLSKIWGRNETSGRQNRFSCLRDEKQNLHYLVNNNNQIELNYICGISSN